MKKIMRQRKMRTLERQVNDLESEVTYLYGTILDLKIQANSIKRYLVDKALEEYLLSMSY